MDRVEILFLILPGHSEGTVSQIFHLGLNFVFYVEKH